MATPTLQTPPQQLSDFIIDDILKGTAPVNEVNLEVFNTDPIMIALGGLKNAVERAVSNGGEVVKLAK